MAGRLATTSRGSYRILLVEDDRGDALLVESALEESLPGAEVIWHPNIPSAEDVGEAAPDCVLVDLGLPGLEQLQALDLMIDLVETVPVIVLTGINDRAIGLTSVAKGAADFLVKGDPDPEVLARSIRYAVERAQAQAARALWRETELLRAENLRLERGLLPRPLVNDPDVVWRARYRPGAGTSVLGGDFFDTIERADGSIRMIIGDVSGHGPDEAALGVALRIAWRTLVLSDRPDDEVLTGLHAVLETERSGEQFCTACDVTISADRRQIATRIAGHPPPILVTTSAQYLPSDHRGLPIGIEESTWVTATWPVDEPWAILMFTDGLIEPVRPDGSHLELEGLLDLMAGRGVPSSGDELDWLLDHLQQPHVDAGHPDDVAIVGMLVR